MQFRWTAIVAFLSVSLLLAGFRPVDAASAPSKSKEEGVPYLNIPLMTKPPTIDGVIDPAEWREATKVMGVVVTSSLVFRDRPISFWVAWDAQHLYIAARSDILPGHRMYRSKREPLTTNVVFDDCYEFGIFMQDRNKLPGHESSFLKIVLNAMGAGEFMKIYPSIGQNMYNWQPQAKVANRIHNSEGRQWWDMELAMDLHDLQMPVENKAGDCVDLLLAAPLKNPDWQWLDFPSTSGHLVHTGFPRLLLTQDKPYVHIENLSGFHDEKIDLKSVIHNPSDREITVNVAATIQYNPPGAKPEGEKKDGKSQQEKSGSKPAQNILEQKMTVTIPARGSVRFDVDKKFPGLAYDITQWGKVLNLSVFDLLVTSTDATPGDPPIYRYRCEFGGTNKSYLNAISRQVVFEYEARFNPATNQIYLVGDTLDAEIPAGSKVAALGYVVTSKDGAVVKDGRITQYIDLKYEDLVQLPALSPGEYQVTLNLLDASGATLATRNDISFEKKDEAKVFAHWWNNSIGNTEKVLQPFEALQVKPGSSGSNETIVTVTRRVYHMNGLGLPQQIIANDGPVLTQPARLVVTIAGKEQAIDVSSSLKITAQKEWRVEFTGATQAAGLSFTVKGSMEQDGLVNLDLTYAPQSKPVIIDDLRVEWPVDDALGSWMTCIGGVGGNYAPRTIGKVPDGSGEIWNTREDIGKAGTKMKLGNWTNNLWVGNDSRGLLWAGDHDRGWVPSDETPAHSLFRDGKSVIMRNHLIRQAKGQPCFLLDAPRTVNLQYNATPFRHLAKGWRLTQRSAASSFSAKDYKTNEKTNKQYFSTLSMPTEDVNEWPEYYARYKAKAQERAKAGWERPGPRLGYFLTNQIALRGYMDKTVEPGLYKYFGADWQTDDGESLNPTYRDYMVYLMDRQVREGGCAHFYFDISFSRTTNGLAAGFGYRLPNGRIQPTSMDGTLREWYKRVWAMMQENNLYPGGVSGHATNSICLKALPWTDAILDSEYPMKDPILVYPPDRMIALSVPQAFGVNIMHLAQMNPMWASMHDAGSATSVPFPSEPFRHFGITADDVQFVGYWHHGQIVKDITPGLKASLWKRPGKAIVQVLNYGLDPQGQEQTRAGRVQLNLQALGVPSNVQPQQLRVSEIILSDRVIPQRYVGHYAWYQELPESPHPRGWKEKVKLRPDAKPTLDASTGTLAGFDLFYHDSRFFLITWDDQPVSPQKLQLLFTPTDWQRVLNWGIGRSETKQLSAAQIGELAQHDASNLQLQIWTQKGTALIRLLSTSAKPADAIVSLDLQKLGVNVPRLWAGYTQCLGGELDYPTGKVTVKNLKPNEPAIVFIDTH